jgi:5-methylthioadenosine/S-adenosylhomocysteine deaminase
MNDDDDILQDIRLAQQLQNIPSIESQSLDASLLLEMATLGGAMVTGFNEIGSITEGKLADLILLSLSDVKGPSVEQSMLLPDLILRRAKGCHVRTVIIGGKIIIKDNKWISLNPNEIIRKLKGSLKPLSRDNTRLSLVLKKALKDLYRKS